LFDYPHDRSALRSFWQAQPRLGPCAPQKSQNVSEGRACKPRSAAVEYLALRLIEESAESPCDGPTSSRPLAILPVWQSGVGLSMRSTSSRTDEAFAIKTRRLKGWDSLTSFEPRPEITSTAAKCRLQYSARALPRLARRCSGRDNQPHHPI
jgi:hypothetical protein